MMVMAEEGVCWSESFANRVVDETGSTAAAEEVSTPLDSNRSSSLASKPVVTHWSSGPEAGP